ncbi:MAG: hypothetical protein FJ224_05120 [Lentisphaerae bacterium]|nr:hypothetical protein [Lentisphaerota bacterium]
MTPSRKPRLCGLILALSIISGSALPTEVHVAVKTGDLAGLSSALDSDPAMINAPVRGGVTPLHVAASMNRRDAAELLIARGADVNSRTDSGFTPLHWAASRDAADVADLLIRSGADINAATPAGITPLHWAAQRNARKTVTALLAAGARIGIRTANGYTPLHWAVMKDANDTATLIAFKAVSDEMASSPPPAQDLDPEPQTNREEALVENRAAASPLVLPSTAYGTILMVSLDFGEFMSFVWVQSLGMWVGQYEVTNGQFRRFRPSHKSMFYEEFSLDGPDQPAVFVSWEDADNFCTWLNRLHSDRIPLLYQARLPTEGEWAQIARCGDNRAYPWGNEWPPKYGNYSDLTSRRYLTDWHGISGYDDGFVVTCPVSKSGVNEWGVYGMGGNVWEWCADWYDNTRSTKVRRGGSWDFDTRPNLKIDARGYDRPDARYDTIGFRVVIAKKPPR